MEADKSVPQLRLSTGSIRTHSFHASQHGKPTSVLDAVQVHILPNNHSGPAIIRVVHESHQGMDPLVGKGAVAVLHGMLQCHAKDDWAMFRHTCAIALRAIVCLRSKRNCVSARVRHLC